MMKKNTLAPAGIKPQFLFYTEGRVMTRRAELSQLASNILILGTLMMPVG
jgi:hypothetical protein